MILENGRNRLPGNAERRISLNDLLRPPISTNGVAARSATNDAQRHAGQTQLQVLVILLPLYYNPDENGKRVRVEPCAFERTFAEIKQYCSGIRLYEGVGWCHSLRFRGDIDEHIKVEIDAFFNAEDLASLKNWKQKLEIRFHQDSIYMSLSGPVLWL
jgi:hypothetical protein